MRGVCRIRWRYMWARSWRRAMQRVVSKAGLDVTSETNGRFQSEMSRTYCARQCLLGGFPALPRWAKLCRAYGAGSWQAARLQRAAVDGVEATAAWIALVRFSVNPSGG